MTPGWEQTTLGEVVSFRGGGTPSTEKPSYWNGDIPWVSPKDMKSSEVGDSIDKITPDAIENSAASLIPKDAILIVVRSGILARTVPVGITTRPLAVNQDIKALCPNKDIDPRYLHYFLQASEPNILKLVTRGATVHRLSTDSLKALKFLKPSLPEQQRIVAVLDKIFAVLATSTANGENNLQNARDLFESYLHSVFDQTKQLSFKTGDAKATAGWQAAPDDANATRTGGRAATTRHIEGKRSLCVGMPKSEARSGWAWHSLDSLARMESGHTPSRRHPEYWGGDVPWIGIRDAKASHGREIFETLEHTNKLGLENSSARLLPAQTVCLSRTASVGYVTVMGRPMATSQDFVNWVCSGGLFPRFLMYLFLAQGDEIFKFSSGAVHQTIYFPEAKAFHICQPSVDEQHQIVETLDALREQAEKLERVYECKIANLAEMKQAILQKAFSGELTSPPTIKEAAE